MPRHSTRQRSTAPSTPNWLRRCCPPTSTSLGGASAEKGLFELYALRRTDGKAALAGEVIASAKDEYDQNHRPVVSMTMTPDGAREWAAITKRNIKRPVAIVLDRHGLQCPEY